MTWSSRGAVALTLAAISTVSLCAQEPREEPAEVRCPSVLGVGAHTAMPFCDVHVQVDPALGIQVVLPRRRGEATLSFNLHNRHIYSRQEEDEGRAYTRYVASVAVVTLDGDVVADAVVMSEFRTAVDLVDRVTGGAGPSGLKAIAPVGTERVRVTVPANIDTVVIVGQSLDMVRLDGRETVTSPGRPIAILSGATVSYRPRP